MPTTNAWRCAVCGYVHRGDAPPECCPICGVGPSEFQEHVEKPAAAAPASVRRWRCTVCGYEHDGDKPPDACPLCSAGPEQFEAAEEAQTVAGGAGGRIVIIGGGVAGVAAAEAARKTSPEATIVLLAKEQRIPYYRINLTRYLAGEVNREDLPIHPKNWYAEQRIDLRLRTEVTRVNLEQRQVEIHEGDPVPFDRLVLTCGAHPFVPPIPGADKQSVFSLRTDEDADQILEAAKAGHRIVCIGGGLLGLETAGALAKRGGDVTVLETHGYLMPAQLTPRAGTILAGHLQRIGVKLRSAVHVKELVGGASVTGVLLEEGDTVPAEAVVLATGVRSNTHLARQAGLTVQKGVVVDNLLRTSQPDVFAAGDATEHLGVLYGNWYVAQFQGGIAGMNAAGGIVEFGGIPRSHTLKVLGLDTCSIGQFLPVDGSYRAYESEADGKYLNFVFHDGCLVGANLLGSTALAGAVKKAIESKTDFSGLLANQPTALQIAGRLTK
jgi:nitrite reductase (NADH) large subunit